MDEEEQALIGRLLTFQPPDRVTCNEWWRLLNIALGAAGCLEQATFGEVWPLYYGFDKLTPEQGAERLLAHRAPMAKAAG